jgi:hypothetical protein
LGFGLFEVIDEFLVLISIVDGEFKFSFFGPQDDRLPFHAADQVEGGLGLSAQGHLQQVVLDARFDGFAQRGGDFKEAVRRAETFNALMGPFVVVVTDPEADAFARRVETLELGTGEELLPDRFPEAFDFAQGHGMVGTRLEVVGAVLLHLGLEASGAAPVHELAAIVGEHLFGWLVFASRDPKDLQDVFGGVAAEEVRPHDEARIVVHEADQVGVAAPEAEGEDIRLPHLVGGGSFEEARPDQVAPGFGRSFDQALLLERFAHALGAGLKEEDPPEQLRDALDPPGGFFLFEGDDASAHRFGQACLRVAAQLALQSLLALEPIAGHPLMHGRTAHAHFLGHQLLGEAFLQVQLNRAQSILKSARWIFFRRSPPRGGWVLLLLYWFILLHLDTSPSLKCQPISRAIRSHDLVASTFRRPR